MKKKIKTFLKKKSHYYIANILLISIILFISIVYSADIFNDRYKEIKEQNKYYNQEYFSNNINTDINTGEQIIATNTDILKKEKLEEENPLLLIKKGLYVEIQNSCDIHFGGSCVRARTCPSLSCPTVISLRDNMVLKTTGETIIADGITWYKIVFDEWVRYPERTAKEWYISGEFLKIIESNRETYKKEAKEKNKTDKKIIIDRSEQKLYAYENEELFMEISISTGLDILPTPRGTFKIFDKTPSRYMQGPLPNISNDYYDLPGVPWTMYFTNGGAAIHGAYWHDNFGIPWSHGCVNLRPVDAEILYKWAPIGTTVIVRD